METDLFKISIEDLSKYLNEIGFIAETYDFIVERPIKGIIKVQDLNFNYLVKDYTLNWPVLGVIIEDVDNYLRGINLKNKKKKGGVIKELKWKCKNEKLAQSLNQDQEIMNFLTEEIKNNNIQWIYHNRHSFISIQIEGSEIYRTIGNQSVDISCCMRNLPSKEFITVFDKIARYYREIR